MYRASCVLLLFTKPATDSGYVARMPPRRPSRPGPMWRRAVARNSDVRAFYTPNAERYEAWYKETYGINDIRDGCAASGASSNKRLDDTKNLETLQQYDFAATDAEMRSWACEFHHNHQLH